LLRERFPRLKLFLREDLTHRLIELLKAGALDAALIALPYDVAGLDYEVVGEDELLAMAPTNHPMSRQATATVSMLQEGLILLEDGHCLRDQALEVCGLNAPKAAAEESLFAATSLHTLVQMVGSGLGVSLLPAMAVEAGLANDAPVTVRHLAVGHPSRRIVVAWRAGSSREVEGRLLADTLKGERPAA
jgi:LysR family hydrogen peroxide-inducible transcriptional activator